MKQLMKDMKIFKRNGDFTTINFLIKQPLNFTKKKNRILTLHYYFKVLQKMYGS